MGVQNQLAIVIVITISTYAYAMIYSYGYTISALVGQAIGLGQIAKARQIMWLCLFTCLFSSSIYFAVIRQYGKCIIGQFINDKVIIDRAYDNLKVFSYVILLESILQNMQSMIKALGLQKKVEVFSIFNNLIVGVPMAYLMAIPCGFGINGLWYGESVGLVLNLIGNSYIVFTSDWKEISQKCQDEMDREV